MKARAKRARFRYLWAEQKGRCIYCDRRMSRPTPDGPLPDKAATLDHIYPRCKGGTDHIDNLALACNRCNVAKGCLMPEAWIERLRRRA